MIELANRQPVSYLQKDPKWKNISYAVKGENSTIGSAGCGPTSAAMLIATLTGKNVTPIDTCSWALKNGYKALNQGTYYSYFVPQFKKYGISCERLNSSRILRQPNNPVHNKAIKLLKEGYYLIALMGPGTWTRSGHFIVVWEYDDHYYINDPASTRTIRTKGDIKTFRNECRMYWAIDARNYGKEESEVTQEEFNKMMDTYLQGLKQKSPSSWSEEARHWAEGVGIIQGTNNGKKEYKNFVTREQLVTFLKRLHDLKR